MCVSLRINITVTFPHFGRKTSEVGIQYTQRETLVYYGDGVITQKKKNRNVQGSSRTVGHVCVCIFMQNSFVIVILQYLRCSQRCLHCWLQIYAKLISNNWIIKCTLNYPIIWYKNKIIHLHFNEQESQSHQPQFFPFVQLRHYPIMDPITCRNMS